MFGELLLPPVGMTAVSMNTAGRQSGLGRRKARRAHRPAATVNSCTQTQLGGQAGALTLSPCLGKATPMGTQDISGVGNWGAGPPVTRRETFLNVNMLTH